MMLSASHLFVCGTDTGVGKTVVTALLLASMREAGLNAAPMKPVETGCPRRGGVRVADDLQRCLTAAGMRVDKELKSLMSPYRLAVPASPHLAARYDRCRIDPIRIQRALATLTARYQPVLIEGAGGLMVPLRGGFLTADLIQRIEAPVILVARSGLGSINHCLLTLDALRHRRIPVVGIVFNDGPADDPRVVADNIRCIPRLGRTRCLGRIPYCPDIDQRLARIAREPDLMDRVAPRRRQWIKKVIHYANQAFAGMVSSR